MDVAKTVLATILSALGIQRLVLPLLAQQQSSFTLSLSSILYPSSELVIVIGSSIFFAEAAEYLWKKWSRVQIHKRAGEALPGSSPLSADGTMGSETELEVQPSPSLRPATLADLGWLRTEFHNSLTKAIEELRQLLPTEKGVARMDQQKLSPDEKQPVTNSATNINAPPSSSSNPPAAKGKKNHVDALLGGAASS